MKKTINTKPAWWEKFINFISAIWQWITTRFKSMRQDVREFYEDLRCVFKKHGWISNTTMIAGALFFAHLLFDFILLGFAAVGVASLI
jgi:hypothetical protein